MRIVLIRHSMTEDNLLHRYNGRGDKPLCDKGVLIAQRAHGSESLGKVFVTPLLRTKQTAKIMFPNAEQFVVDGLREMDFGDFEGRTADEMEDDPAYRAWVAGMCEGTCPGGESLAGFSKRVCDAFEETVQGLLSAGEEEAYFVVHGGTIMAVLERFSVPKSGFYDHLVTNCMGFESTLLTPDDLVRSGCAEDAAASRGLPFVMVDVTKWGEEDELSRGVVQAPPPEWTESG